MHKPQQSWHYACLCSILNLLPVLSGMFEGCLGATCRKVLS